MEVLVLAIENPEGIEDLESSHSQGPCVESVAFSSVCSLRSGT